MPQTTEAPLINGLKAAGEVLVIPGASLALDGDIKGASIHMAGAIVARVLLGPIGWAYFAVDSYSKSVTGKTLYQSLTNK